MAEWFPSREWLDAYRTALNDNETYREASEGWGVDFAGDFVFEITDVPVAETTIGDLPDDLSNDLRESLESLSADRIDDLLADAPSALTDRMDGFEGLDRDRFRHAVFSTPLADVPAVTSPELEAAYPADLADLLGQLERDVHGDTIYAYLDLHDGECREVDVLDAPPPRDPGFVLTGPYRHWTDLLDGADVMASIFAEDLELDGSTTTILPYNEAAQELGDTAGRVDTRFLF